MHAAYHALWRWSTDDLSAFWATVWDYFKVQSPTPYRAVLDTERTPGARWFDGAQVNYAQQVFRHAGAALAAGHSAVVFANDAKLARAAAATCVRTFLSSSLYLCT